MDQISPQIQNKVLNRGALPVSPQSVAVQTEAITTTCVILPGLFLFKKKNHSDPAVYLSNPPTLYLLVFKKECDDLL